MTSLEILRSIGTVTNFSKDEIVFMEDDPGDNFYIVLKGEFGVYVNSFVDFPVHVAAIEQGSFFGEMSVIDGWSRSATIKAEQDGTALAVSRDRFGLLLEKCPDIADSILKVLHDRAESTADTVRKDGKYVPPPPRLSNTDDADEKLSQMTGLARYIRQTNDMLYESPAPQNGIIKLFPEGYTLINAEDENDNSGFLQERRVNCPYCRKRFEAFVPNMQKLVQSHTNPDGRVIYKDFNILLYTNLVCPNCNYSDSYREFCKYTPIAEAPLFSENQFENVEHFTGFAETHRHTADEAVLSCYLNLAGLNRVTTDPLRFAKVWIRLFWIFSDYKSPGFAKEAAGKAMELYDRFLSKNKENMSEYDELRINVILGELSAAMGEFRLAQRYYEINARMGKIKSFEARELVDMSLKRYRELKDFIN